MKNLPLKGLRVLEFTQMVMGPCCGLILADLGAEVIKIEPLPRGDRTRYLSGLAAGFFAAFNRNKKSIAVDMKSPEGLEVVKRLMADSDVVIENFRPGRMESLGLAYDTLSGLNEKLIYCSLKGFLPGPYEHRSALDEVVQMMGGLAYMTGLPGKPMRAGASVNDVMGAMFGVIAIQAAVRQRESTGKGQEVQASLFENNVFLMAQAMLAEAVTGEPSEPWSVKERPWPVYDLFDMPDGTQLFVGIIGDGQWHDFCVEFGREEWLKDARLQSNNERAKQRYWLLPEVREMLRTLPVNDLIARLEAIGLPFAPVRRPGELLNDPHLLASGGLIDIKLPDGTAARTPALPITFGGSRLNPPGGLPAVGADTREVLLACGLDEASVSKLLQAGVVSDVPLPAVPAAGNGARAAQSA
ncbi:CaiB/BaiF CoA transferase family protein [Phyllobacterium sophorae]|uniref:Formyl-CoA transferase n=1 Tax=Phyllobacterium sophorae TaxID=1520277 RepID=A0A2P7B6N7_9HYPH|nr:CoA transferase [Phyllobacterium sophorae]PSH62109.1 formyl-CoA transferase [Phyllobacterium sophorae]